MCFSKPLITIFERGYKIGVPHYQHTHLLCFYPCICLSHSHPDSGMVIVTYSIVKLMLQFSHQLLMGFGHVQSNVCCTHGSLLEDYFLFFCMFFFLQEILSDQKQKTEAMLYFQKLVYGYILQTLFFS